MMVLGCQTFSSVIYQQGVQGTELFKLRTDSVAINSSLLSFYCDFLHWRWVLKEKKLCNNKFEFTENENYKNNLGRSNLLQC